MNNLIIKAFRFADKQHAGQFRKVTGSDYISHPLMVSYLVAAFKRSKHLEELIVAAILHDVLEDTPTSFDVLAREFTPLVASLVLELSSDKAEIARVGKLEYLKKKLVGMSSWALVLKLADRLHNVSDHPTVQTLQDTRALMGYLKANRKLTTSHKNLIVAIESRCAGE